MKHLFENKTAKKATVNRLKPSFEFMNVRQPVQFSDGPQDAPLLLGAPANIITQRTPKNTIVSQSIHDVARNQQISVENFNNQDNIIEEKKQELETPVSFNILSFEMEKDRFIVSPSPVHKLSVEMQQHSLLNQADILNQTQSQAIILIECQNPVYQSVQDVQQDENLDDFYANLAQELAQSLEIQPQVEVQNIKDNPDQQKELDQFYQDLVNQLAMELESEVQRDAHKDQQIIDSHKTAQTVDLDQFYDQLQIQLAAEIADQFRNSNEQTMNQETLAARTNDLRQNIETSQQSDFIRMESQQSKGVQIIQEQQVDLIQTQPSQNEIQNIQNLQEEGQQNQDVIANLQNQIVVDVWKQDNFKEQSDHVDFIALERNNFSNLSNQSVEKQLPELNLQMSSINFGDTSYDMETPSKRKDARMKLKKLVSGEDVLMESLIKRLKPENSLNNMQFNSELTIQSEKLPQMHECIPEEDQHDILEEESSDSQTGSKHFNMYQRMENTFKNKFKKETRQFAIDVGIEPDCIQYQKESEFPDPKNSEKALLNVIIPQFAQFNELDIPKTIVSQKVQLILVKSVLKKLQEETSENKDGLRKVNKKIEASRKLLPIIVDQLVEQVSNFQIQFNKIQNKHKSLHFAFLFACPLVMSYQIPESTQTKYKLIPLLNHHKEFEKIEHRLTRSGAKVSVKKRQCTIEHLKSILQDQPLGIHFSGHGILNTPEQVGEYHYLHKDEGDFLLMETTEGDSQLVSRKQLQRLITSTGTNLNFVFIATCHSEFVGKIFLEAGAKHVICIEQNDEVMDDAVIAFTDTFYGSILKQTVSIEKAFRESQLVVSISFGESEAKIFKLLKQPKQEQSRSVNDCFGPFDDGKWVNHEIQITMKFLPQKVAYFVGRQKDMFKLIQKIMSNQTARLITMIGLPGVGKSALIKNTIHHIQERNLLIGGCIFSNAQNLKDCEVFIKQIVAQILFETRSASEFFSLHQITSQRVSEIEKLNSILSILGQLNGTVLIVVDNAEDLIVNDRINFRNIVRLMLLSCPNTKVVLTSRVRLASLPEYPEEIVIINELSAQNSCQLFKNMTRDITKKEINNLLSVKPDFSKYPDEINKKQPTQFYEHHFFVLLGGNPQAIILIAPLLADLDRNLTLNSLYSLLASNSVQSMLEQQNIEDKMLASLKACLQISIQLLNETDPICMKLFYLLAMLPGGATEDELDQVWNSIDEPTSWRQVLFQLEKSALIEHAVCQSTQKKKIKLPIFVGAYGEAMIDTEQKKTYHNLIVSYLHSKMVDWYSSIQNTLKTDLQDLNETIRSELISCEQNVWSMISRMSEIYSQIEEENYMEAFLDKQVQRPPNRQRKQSVDIDPRKFIKFMQTDTQDMTKKITFSEQIINPDDKIFENEWTNLTIATNKVSNQVRKEVRQDDQSMMARSKYLWRWAFNKILEKRQKEQRSGFNLNLKKQNFQNEYQDSDENEDNSENFSFECSPVGKLSDDYSKITSMIKQSSQFLKRRLTVRNPLKTQSQNVTQDVAFKRKATLIESQTALIDESNQQMTIDEQLLCFYIYSLLLLDQTVMVLRLVKKFLGKFNRCSNVFQGNIMRIKAFCSQILLKNEAQQIAKQKNRQISDIQIDYSPVLNALTKALGYFQVDECAWGLGLTEFQFGLHYEMQENMQKAEFHLKNSFRHFQKINHYRGLALCCKHLCSIEKTHESQSLKQINLYQKKHTEYIIRWRTSSSQIFDYLSINRERGEDFSLQSEIVLLMRVNSLYKQGGELIFKISKLLNQSSTQEPIQEQDGSQESSEDSSQSSSESYEFSDQDSSVRKEKLSQKKTVLTEGQKKIKESLKQIFLLAQQKSHEGMSKKNSQYLGDQDWQNIKNDFKDLILDSNESARMRRSINEKRVSQEQEVNQSLSIDSDQSQSMSSDEESKRKKVKITVKEATPRSRANQTSGSDFQSYKFD